LEWVTGSNRNPRPDHPGTRNDISYVRKDQAETSALFELIAARYERRSTMITANQPFSGWDAIFPDKAMTVAAIDRLVHHATIFEMNVESYRRRAAYAAATSISDIENTQQKETIEQKTEPNSNSDT
jgi:predicted transcriptional regulator